MAELYRSLLADARSPADALVAAKRAAIASNRFACPVFWGAFVLTGGRAGEAPKQRGAARPIPNPATQVSDESAAPMAVLSKRDRALLGECARAWESAWKKADRPEASLHFFGAATELGRSLAGINGSISPTARTLLGLVQQNCRVALEHWAKRQQAAVAVEAYLAYLTWLPSARSEEWDAVASAYRRENRDAVRRLSRAGKLRRTFELFVESKSDASLRTAVTWVAAHQEEGIAPPLEVALPADPAVKCSSGRISYCDQLGWIVFRVAAGETVRMVERLAGYVRALDDDTLLLGGTWGSLLIPHDLTIRFREDFVPVRLQRERLGKTESEAAIRFTSEGAVVTLRAIRGPWLENVAILFRHAPGATEMFAAPNSPFLAETEFGEFERLFELARRAGEN
jgi:hypothetical protein